MSKIIYLTPPAHGHVNPTLPVVQELIQRGEQVICYNNEDFRAPLERTGATFHAYAKSDMTSAEISRLLEDGNIAKVTRLILKSTPQLLPALLDELAASKPDLVIFDSIALWGKMAATRLQLRAAASITHFVMDERNMSRGDMFRMLRLTLPIVPGILSARQRLIKTYGNACPMTSPLFPMRDRLNLCFTDRALQPDTSIIDNTFHFVGPSINPETRSGDFPVEELGRKPLVYISLGTIHSNQPEFFRTCIEAFANFPAQFVLSVGKELDIGGLGQIPQNLIVRASVPQLLVLEHTDVFITHAGINSVHEGLYYGVPLILIPQQFEQLLNARCVAARGAGIIIQARLQHKPITAEALRRALDATLNEPRYRDAALELKKSVHATGGYKQAADEIQAYLAKG